MAGAHIQIEYEQDKVSISSVNAGDFFNPQSGLFIDDNPEVGLLSIYTSFLGSDSTTGSGPGNIATLVLSTITAGQSFIKYTSDSELVDAEDNAVVLNGLGQGEINVQ